MPPQTESNSGVYTRAWRIVTGALVAIEPSELAAAPVARLARRRSADHTADSVSLADVFSIAPGTRRVDSLPRARARVEVDASGLRVERRRLEIEFPTTAIERLEPWRVPLPGPGFSLRMRSGRLASYRLQVDDPAPLIAALEHAAGTPSRHRAATHPIVAWAHARAMHPTPSWLGRAAKFVLFALPPAAILFNAHQHISYGGLWGQYYQEGLEPYLLSATLHWATVSIYLVLYASALRAAAETVTLAGAFAAPSAAASLRRGAEIFCSAAYYLGVPLLLALRFRS